jgi:two-component sensor histidine kinase
MRRRFIITLILAILPIALLTSGQAIWRLLQAYEMAEAGLRADARTMASDKVMLMVSAEAVLRTLESQPDIRSSAEGCSAAISKALSGTSFYTNIFILDKAGRIQCSALPVDPGQVNAGSQDWWQELRGRTTFFVSGVHFGLVSRVEVLTAALPLFDDTGNFDGALAVGIRVAHIRLIFQKTQLPASRAAAIFDSDGAMIATGGASEMHDPFAALGALQPGSVMSVSDSDGHRWLVTMEAIGGSGLLVAYAGREDAMFVWSYVDVAVNILLPLTMLAFAFWIIWYAADRLVLRWVSYLQRVAKAYGKGHLAFRPSSAVRSAPGEIRHLAAAMGDMAESIRQRDASLRNALEQRSLMLREIHHRVKNNLQIVGSLMQIEARLIEEPAAQAALKITSTRINAIALAHRLLEEVDAQTVVNLQPMISDLVGLLHDAFGEGLAGDGLKVDAPDLLIETDVAVPLALLMVELISGIYKMTIADRRGALSLDITLSREDEKTLRLQIAYEGPTDQALQNGGPDFTSAYLRQLRATLERRTEHGRSLVTLIFKERSACLISPGFV